MADVVKLKAAVTAATGDAGHHDRADSTLEARIAASLRVTSGSPESADPFVSQISAPPIFSLPDGLLIEIISNLFPNDIHACRQSCRKLNDIIVDSRLIQYIIRTALSGVFDPLDLGLSLPERFDSLLQWETAWAEVDLRTPNARIDAPVLTGRGHPVEFSFFGRYFVMICEGYAMSAGYSFLDMHATFTSHATAALWTTIKIKTPNVLVFAFASELDLVVSISCVNPSLARSPALTLTLTLAHASPFLHRFWLFDPCRLGHPTFPTIEKQR
jgi:hypothetical protein